MLCVNLTQYKMTSPHNIAHRFRADIFDLCIVFFPLNNHFSDDLVTFDLYLVTQDDSGCGEQFTYVTDVYDTYYTVFFKFFVYVHSGLSLGFSE